MVETLRYRQETNLTTSEAARDWTECSPNSKLVDIANKLAHYNWDDWDELRSLIENRKYKEFQSKIWINNPKDLDWKLWINSFRFLCNYIKKQRRETHEIKRETKALDKLQEYVRTWEESNEEAEIKINRAANRYLSKHETLDEYTYNGLFSGKEDIQQWNIWDCYLVSWIMELANTQYFDTLMRTSISRVRFKDDWSLWYNIRIPLWEPNGRDILIKDSEITTAKLRWSIGYQLLEIAHIKNKRENSKEWNKYAPITNSEYANIKWWSTAVVLEEFLGKNNIGFCNFWTTQIIKNWLKLSALDSSKKAEITNFFKNYNPYVWNRFAFIATSPSPTWEWDTASFLEWWDRFYFNHALALTRVEKDSNGNVSKIHLRNPWNKKNWDWTWDLAISLDTFFNAFSYIEVWLLKNTNTFLDDKWISLT